MRLRRLLALWMVAACGGGDGGGDDGMPLDPCSLASVVPGGSSELGLGDTFAPLVEGQTVTLELGLQGLWMFLVNARVPEGSFHAGDLAGVTAVAKLEATGEVASLEVSCRSRMLVPAGDGYLQLENPYLLPIRPELTPQLEGARATLTLDVRDPDGNVARDARGLVMHLPPRAR